MKYYYIYILKCSDDSYYTGVTNNLERRLAEHQAGTDTKCYTFSRRPLELVYVDYSQNAMDAIAHEKQIKGWTRAKKMALINKDMELLSKLSKCLNDTVSSNQPQ
jgi:putative endonuclease